MSVCDSADAKADREEEKWRDAEICHWGNEGLRSSALNAFSCLTNGRGGFRIRGSRLGGSFVNVTPVFFCSHLSSSALFSCTFLSFFNVSPSFGSFQSFIISSWPSLTHCLSPPPFPCLPPLLSSSLSLPVCPFTPLTSLFLFIHIPIFVCVSFPLSLFFVCFSGGKADEWLDRAIPLLRGYRFNLRGHRHQQLGVLSKRPWSLEEHRINDLCQFGFRCSLIRSTNWERC